MKEGLRIKPIARFSAATAGEWVSKHLESVERAHQLKLEGAQFFGGGQVYAVIMPDVDNVQAGVWEENASINIPQQNRGRGCAFPHEHGGERVLFTHTAPNSALIVMSYQPIVVDDSLRLGWTIPKFEDKDADGKQRYFALIPPCVEVTMRFAAGVSHGFYGLGKTYTRSVHPNELAEIGPTNEGPSLSLQTKWVGKAPLECKTVAANLKALSEESNLPRTMVGLINNYVNPGYYSSRRH